MRFSLSCFLPALLVVAVATAQVGANGTIQGTVTDASGAVLAGASVTATKANGVDVLIVYAGDRDWDYLRVFDKTGTRKLYSEDIPE